MLDIKRKPTRKIFIGPVDVGGDAPIRVQSMTNTDTRNIEATVKQIKSLERAGCEIIRVAAYDMEAAKTLSEIKKRISIPLIADIHFDYKLALESIKRGADAIRINPGNIGGEKGLKKIIDACKERKIPIRIGVNSGSIEKHLLNKYGGPCAKAMVESALRKILLFEKKGFYDLKISLKSSSIKDTLEAYEQFSARSDYPLHIGITEAGGILTGTVKSSVGLGILLYKGIGDTLRVSLTGDPIHEVRVCWEILRSLGIRERGPEIISCPTCGRTRIDIIEIVKEIEEYLQNIPEVFKVAIMGCVVNGPGEAREADIGLAGGDDMGVIFKKGKVVKKIYGQKNLVREFKKELSLFLTNKTIQRGKGDEI